MKTIYKIKLHPLFYLVALIAIFTGHFHDFFLFLIIILFHELGHIITGLLLRWKIKQVKILPFGAITVFDEGLTKSLKEEFIISIAGVLFQIVIYNLLKNSYNISAMHYLLLCFNLLPIMPLDGSKILNILLNVFYSFKRSLELTIIISLVWILIMFSFLILNGLNFIFLLVILFLLVKIIDELKNKDYVVNRFLYERYYFPKKYKRIRIIIGSDESKMYKECNHIFKVKNNSYTEHEILRKRFDFKKKL